MRKKIALGTETETGRVVVAYTGDRHRPYLLECKKCGKQVRGQKRAFATKCKACSMEHPKIDIRRRLEYLYKRTAKKNSVPYKLTFDEFCKLIKQDCFYCGTQPSQVFEANRKSDNTLIYNGIDRRINHLGYTKDNAKPCCSFCNYIKSAHDIEVLKEKVRLWSERVEKW
jgi:ribosomal protein L33